MFTVLYLVHHETFLQNETDVITKYEKVLLQNGSDFLFQNTTVLIQNATVIKKYVGFIRKCDSSNKMRRLLQNMSVHGCLPQKIQEKKQVFLVSGTVFVAQLFEVRSITVTDFSFYFTLIQACSVTKLEFQRFYKSFIEILLISFLFQNVIMKSDFKQITQISVYTRKLSF